MKPLKIVFLFLLSTYYLILNTNYISAHVVESDNTVGAVMHIDPGDDPVAREQSFIMLEFKDTKGIFNLENCECFLSVTKNNQEILKTSISPVSGNEPLSAAVSVIFPEKGVFNLKISGQPEEDIDFKEFELSYEIAVNKEAVPPESPNSDEAAVPENWISTHLVHVFGGLAILAFLVFALVKQSVKKPKQ